MSVEIGVARRGDVADRRDLRHADAEDLAGRACRAWSDADEHGRGALLHQGEGGLGVGRVADRDRDRHVAGELGERQRVVLGGDVPRRRHLALDEEQVGAVLGAERAEPPGDARRGRDRGLRARRVDRLDAVGDEVLADRLLIRLRQDVVDLGVRCRRDPLQDRVGIVVAGLDALEVEDREPAEPCQLPGHPGIHDRVHRRGEDRDLELDAAERPG